MTDKAISPLHRRATETQRTRVAPLLEPDRISAADHAAPLPYWSLTASPRRIMPPRSTVA